MNAPRVNRVTGRVLVFLSFVALLTVLSGYFQSPQPDEGTGAHIFQLSVVLLVPTIVVFLATADWAQPLQRIRFLTIPGTALVLAFAALYYLEHHWWNSGAR